jgi:signal peptidase II
MQLIRILLIAILVILIDQSVKQVLIDVMRARAFVPLYVMPSFNLVMVWNKGVSFGILSSADARHALIFLPLIVVGALLWWHRKNTAPIATVGVGLIAGGALGNMIDRFHYKAVADFFDIYIAGYHWPAFNVADMCIVCGVGCLCYMEWKLASLQRHQKSVTQEDSNVAESE